MLVWPASALLTGNGVAFILRVPGTEHGDWWSMNGWWIFAGTAAVSLLSKYLIRLRGAHVFNPSNFGLVLCFLTLGPERADPLDFWWGPMSPALALALAIIVVGRHRHPVAARPPRDGALVLGRLRRRGGRRRGDRAFDDRRWHLGPVEGAQLWTILAFSPEILVFLFFMLTDPKTVPAGRRGGSSSPSRSRCSQRCWCGRADRVLGEGRGARGTGHRLRGAARALAVRPVHPARPPRLAALSAGGSSRTSAPSLQPACRPSHVADASARHAGRPAPRGRDPALASALTPTSTGRWRCRSRAISPPTCAGEAHRSLACVASPCGSRRAPVSSRRSWRGSKAPSRPDRRGGALGERLPHRSRSGQDSPPA